jgi:hypothetical protein
MYKIIKKDNKRLLDFLISQLDGVEIKNYEYFDHVSQSINNEYKTDFLFDDMQAVFLFALVKRFNFINTFETTFEKMTVNLNNTFKPTSIDFIELFTFLESLKHFKNDIDDKTIKTIVNKKTSKLKKKLVYYNRRVRFYVEAVDIVDNKIETITISNISYNYKIKFHHSYYRQIHKLNSITKTILQLVRYVYDLLDLDLHLIEKKLFG